ncbi:MAG: sulfide/dihydroorotate dehydrogenase-like FAD/NAD-binding protein [Planctomycetia bacterium]|nr:sulfide/dihydroorotate dehydrogenase-like FAD/NAD-binding protein [Planctomycetia bacterium]
MFKILKKTEIAPKIYEFIIHAPEIARKAFPGHFIICMAEEIGERIPLTVADYDREAGTITLVLMQVGVSTTKLARLQEGDSLYALIGPLGHPSEMGKFGTVILVAGGVGTAPVYPIAKMLHELGNHVIVIQGARNQELLFWTDKIAAVCDEHIITTDDGSYGRKGLVTEPLKEILEARRDEVKYVWTIGPAIMMKFCAKTTEPYGVTTFASLNTIMIDGTGMCGGCRVTVGQKTFFTCCDGPEFDAHQIDWDSVLKRQQVYKCQEKCSMDRYVEEYQKTVDS